MIVDIADQLTSIVVDLWKKSRENRAYMLLVFAFLVFLIASIALEFAPGFAELNGREYWRDLSMNLATDIAGAGVFFVIIDIYLRRGQERDVKIAQLMAMLEDEEKLKELLVLYHSDQKRFEELTQPLNAIQKQTMLATLLKYSASEFAKKV